MSLAATFRQTFRAMRHRNFRLFVIGQLVSVTGTWMQSLAQGWLVWRLTESPFMLGLVGFAAFGPVLFLGLLGGIAADRYDRHKLVLATQVAAFLQSVVLALLTLSGAVTAWMVIALAAVLGVVNAFDFPARQSFLVMMVGRDDLSNAIALNSSMFNGARIVGPSLAGLVVGAFGEGVCFVLNAVSYLAVIASLLLMRFSARPHPPPPQSAWRKLRDGFGYAWRTPHVRALLSLMAVTSLFGLSYLTFLPAVADQVLRVGPEGLGVMMAAVGIGALAGAILMAYRQGITGLPAVVGGSATGFGAAVVVLGASRSFWLSCVALALAGYAVMSQMAGTNTLLQSLVDDRMRGRLMSLYTVVFAGLMPIGSLLLGRAAGTTGLPPVLAVSGGVTLLGGAAFWVWARGFPEPLDGPRPAPGELS